MITLRDRHLRGVHVTVDACLDWVEHRDRADFLSAPPTKERGDDLAEPLEITDRRAIIECVREQQPERFSNPVLPLLDILVSLLRSAIATPSVDVRAEGEQRIAQFGNEPVLLHLVDYVVVEASPIA
jgi:hypothetical protein